MHINRAADIALRLLMLVAARGGQHTVGELATVLNVPVGHVAKVVQRLSRLGLLETTRGRSGGVRLVPDALRTTVGQVVRAIDGTGEVVNCDAPPCPLRPDCRLRGALRRAQEAFLASLDAVVLDDLVAPAGRTGSLAVLPFPRAPDPTGAAP
ncbi:MAG: Rrf2 family transcriptional regulator [Actinobacteria bacterium]|nr:Rrf2 family transcriptional regulator [Actinomycetota bacterium]